MEQLNEKLDEILIEFFDTLESRFHLQENLDEQMKSGFLQMSRARYSMGVKAVGASQFNEKDMISLFTVGIPDESESTHMDMFLINNVNGKGVKNDKDDMKNDNDNMENEKDNKNDSFRKTLDSDIGVGLRKRNVGHSGEVTGQEETNKFSSVETLGQNSETVAETENSDLSSELVDKKLDKLSLQDPIKWFGVLVPQSLRQSQNCFKNSINTVVQIANSQNKLQNLKNKYTDLMSQKVSKLKL